MKLKVIIIFLAVFSVKIFPQQNEMITVIGDSLIGKSISGEMIREVFGNVVLTQGDVVITCDKAIQFITKNDAELIGNVVVKQDSLTITTPRGFYYGDEKKAESSSGLKLDDQKVILTADSGVYYFDEDIAFFESNVRLYDTTTTLTSKELTYFKAEDRSVAVGSVKIIDKENIIYADSLEHFRNNRITIADNNVRIINQTNNVIIFGDHLEDYSNENYTLVNENPLLMQIDTSFVTQIDSVSGDPINTAQLDTLIIKSLLMEAFRDTQNIFEAKDSVEIWRGNFASKNNYTIYYREDQKIITEKNDDAIQQPILWYENSQLTGDSITIFLVDNKIELLEVEGNAFVNSQSELFSNRFDQISGERLKLYFDENGINRTEVYGGVLSIYYLFEDELPNGLNKSSSQSAAIVFEEKKVSEVRLYGSPVSEYYPEPQVMGKELSYTLPGYIFYDNRPQKNELLKNINETKYTNE